MTVQENSDAGAQCRTSELAIAAVVMPWVTRVAEPSWILPGFLCRGAGSGRTKARGMGRGNTRAPLPFVALSVANVIATDGRREEARRREMERRDEEDRKEAERLARIHECLMCGDELDRDKLLHCPTNHTICKECVSGLVKQQTSPEVLP